MNKKNPFLKALASFGGTIARLIIPQRKIKMSALEEEALQTPWKTIMKNYRRSKLGMIGLIGFILVLLFSFGGSVVVGSDLNYTEFTLSNIKPSRNFIKFPAEVGANTDKIKKIVSGSTFSIALMNDGSLHVWGTECNQKLKDVSDYILDIPAEVKAANIVDIATGGRHIIAIDDAGQFYGWGIYGNGQTILPNALWVEKLDRGMINIVQLLASQQWSAVVCDDGNLYLWGGMQAESTFIVPWDEAGGIIKAAAGDTNMALLSGDGTLFTIGDRGTEYMLDVPPELTDGSVFVADIASSNRNVLALDSQGKLYLWGSIMEDLMKMPEITGKVKSIIGSYKNFVVLLDDGSIVLWGASDLKQFDMPKNMGKIKTVFADYSKFYAVGENGTLYAWGNKGYFLGTDQYGRDLLTRIIHGGRISLTVGAIAVLISTIIALLVGITSGFVGGWVDMILMRFTDIVMSIPFLPIAITLSALIGNTMSEMMRLFVIMAIMGILMWPGLARLIRAQILLEREKDFVLAARSLGIKGRNIASRHILPNIFNILIVNITLDYASSLLLEAGLSFLGFGVAEPRPSWGNMLQRAQQTVVLEYYWWRWIIPGMCIILAALCINLVGDALREAMDPKASER